MKVRVKLFAVARQRLGRDCVEVELPEAATVHQLRGAVIEQFPPLADVVRHSRFAINSEYVSDTQGVGSPADVALIPPVSGG